MSDLRKALRSLPKDLDETYARILQNVVNKGYGSQVAKILQWLAYSEEPMSLNEIAEVLTVDMESDPLVDFERRPQDPQDLLELCSGLVSVSPRGWWGKGRVQFAHFSVREYLASLRLDTGPATIFALDEMRANTLIAESCIAYNIQVDSIPIPVKLDRHITYEKYPLWRYAADKWSIHARNARESGRIVFLCARLFRSRSTTSQPLSWPGISSSLKYLVVEGRFSPLHCAIFFSLPKIMRKLILEGAHVNSRDENSGQTPLIRVILGKMRRISDVHQHLEDVQFLLNHGAEINACDDEGCTALIHASRTGFTTIVRTLLDSGADLEAQDQDGETALLAALYKKKTEIVHLLLNKGASIKSPIGEKALGIASAMGSSEIVQILLDRGIDVDASCDLTDPCEFACTALIRALAGQKYETAGLLVRNGADVNARFSVGNRDAVLLEHVFANTETLHRNIRVYYSSEDAWRTHPERMFMFLVEHGADPKLVRTDRLYLEQKERYNELISEFNTALSLEEAVRQDRQAHTVG